MQTMKIISKRPMKEDPIKDAKILQRTMRVLRGDPLVPKGVYRFKTEEEADRWMMEQIVNTHVRLKSKT